MQCENIWDLERQKKNPNIILSNIFHVTTFGKIKNSVELEDIGTLKKDWAKWIFKILLLYC